MTETATNPVEEANDPEDTGAKAEIAEAIDKWVTEKTGKRIGKTGGKRVFDLVVGMVFAAAVKDEEFRFPGGHGALHIRHLGVGTKPKRLPSGRTAILGPGRKKLRYIEGVTVKKMMGTLKEPSPAAKKK